MKKYYKSLLIVLLLVGAFFALSTFVVSADNNNSNNQNNNYGNFNDGHDNNNHDNDHHDNDNHHETPTPIITPTPTPGHEDCDDRNWRRDHEDNCSKPTITPTPSTTITPTPMPTPMPTPTDPPITPTPTTTAPSTNSGGPFDDGLGCAHHDCSGNQIGGPVSTPTTQQVLGASTGPQVLGLSTTSGEENYLLQIIQAAGTLFSGGLGLIFFKKNG